MCECVVTMANSTQMCEQFSVICSTNTLFACKSSCVVLDAVFGSVVGGNAGGHAVCVHQTKTEWQGKVELAAFTLGLPQIWWRLACDTVQCPDDLSGQHDPRGVHGSWSRVLRCWTAAGQVTATIQNKTLYSPMKKLSKAHNCSLLQTLSFPSVCIQQGRGWSLVGNTRSAQWSRRSRRSSCTGSVVQKCAQCCHQLGRTSEQWRVGERISSSVVH